MSHRTALALALTLTAAPLAAQAGYATVKTYECSWLSIRHFCGGDLWYRQQQALELAALVLPPLATGVGFGLVVLGHQRWVRWRDRRAVRQRLYRLSGQPYPSLGDRLWRATMGRVVAWGIKLWQDERSGPR